MYLAAFSFIVQLCCWHAAAVNMTYYAPAKNVDSGLGNFVDSFYTFAEGNTSTTSGFITFFAPNATVALGPVQSPVQTFATPAMIGVFKEAECSGDCVIREHFPTNATVISDTPANKTFSVLGFAKGHLVNGSCAAASYETRFTILKKSCGHADLVPGNASLILLNLVQQTDLAAGCDSF